MAGEIRLAYLKDPERDNPTRDKSYLGVLGIYPNLREEISARVLNFMNIKLAPISINSLNDNSGIVSLDELNRVKRLLVEELKILEKITGNPKSICIVCDDCFTNQLLIGVIRNILGEENFSRFVDIVRVDFEKEFDDSIFDEIGNNKLVILGGSLSDTYSIHHSHYSSRLSNFIKSVSSGGESLDINSRILGVCFGNQLIANLVGIEHRETSPIILTTKGSAQFGPSICSLIRDVNRTYSELLSGVSNYGFNGEISTFFTRTGYVNLQALGTGDSAVIPLIVDEATGTVVGWGTKNGKVLGVQFHPEISFFHQTEFLLKNVENVLKMLEAQYENPMELLNNFDFKAFEKLVKRDISEEFYTFVIYFFLKSILDKIISGKTGVQDEREGYDVALRKVIIGIRSKVKMVVEDGVLFNQETRAEFLLKSDFDSKLVLNRNLDWKINRPLEEVSSILGIKDLGELFESHMKFMRTLKNGSRVHYFVDLGAGDGTLIRDMYSKYKKQDVVFYGVADKIYLDIFPPLRKKGEEMGIPEEVIILFVETFLNTFSRVRGSLYKRVTRALEQTNVRGIRTIHYSSIVSKKTNMFSSEGETELSNTSMEYIKGNPGKIERLKEFLVENLFKLSDGYFERIYLSSFSDFFSQGELGTLIDFMVSIRATSHIDGKDYFNILTDYVANFASPGSIFFDNGVHRSYSSIPRIIELHKLSELAGDSVRVRLIYDETTNYFTSAVIEKAPFQDEDFIKSRLSPGHRIVPIKEARDSTFFQLEYFLRNFISTNFKNNDVFWEQNKDIIGVIKLIMMDLKNNRKYRIKKMILIVINKIATNFKNDNISYNPIDMETLEKYSIGGETLDDIIGKDIFIPDWMNLEANRKY